jgi:hydrogenase 3 maturation protease
MDLVALEKALTSRIGGIRPERIVFVGVGNRLRGDDAIGPAVIDAIKGSVPHAIDAGVAPENYTGMIKRLRPLAIIFIDALDFGGAPGSMALVESGEIRRYGASTHGLSLEVAMDYLRQETGADVLLIGVQPERICEEEGLSLSIVKPINGLAAMLIKAIRDFSA